MISVVRSVNNERVVQCSSGNQLAKQLEAKETDSRAKEKGERGRRNEKVQDGKKDDTKKEEETFSPWILVMNPQSLLKADNRELK